MVQKNEKSPQEQIVELYEPVVKGKHADLVTAWPVLSGYNAKVGTYKNWLIVILPSLTTLALFMIAEIDGDAAQGK